MYRSRIAGGRVVELIQGRDGEVERCARGRRRRRADAEVRCRGRATAIVLLVPVIEEVVVSVAVIVWLPAVSKVDAERADAVGERGVRRQGRGGIAAREMYHARIAGGRVVELIQGRDGEVERRARRRRRRRR